MPGNRSLGIYNLTDLVCCESAVTWAPSALKASIYIPENRFNYPTTKGFRMNISMKLVTNTCLFSLLSHPHQIIFIHYQSRIANSRLVHVVVDEDDNGGFRLERVNMFNVSDSVYIKLLLPGH